MKLQDKVALITGSGDGLGKGIALAYAKEGAKIVINDLIDERIRSAVAEVEALGGEALGVRADVSRSAEVKAMFAEAVARFGTLDILVNNAAKLDTSEKASRARLEFYKQRATPVPIRSLEVTRNLTDEEWQSFIDVNLTAVFYCMREALNIMEPKGHGHIINIASTGAISGFSTFSPQYSAAKGGVAALTRSVAMEVIGASVNVNCIAPGGVATPSWEQLVPKEAKEIVLQLIPARRMGTIEEFASLAVYLASEDSNDLVGQTISPNGGLVM